MENAENEDVIFEGSASVSAYIAQSGFLWTIIFGWNIGLLIGFYDQLTTKIKVTKEKISITRGLISQREENIDLYRIIDSAYYQSVIGRLTKSGTITLISDDVTSPELTITIENPKYYIEIIREQVLKERKRMRSMNVD